jgi:hypothetical protein
LPQADGRLSRQRGLATFVDKAENHVAYLLFFATIKRQDAVDILADMLWHTVDWHLIRRGGVGVRSIDLV